MFPATFDSQSIRFGEVEAKVLVDARANAGEGKGDGIISGDLSAIEGFPLLFCPASVGDADKAAHSNIDLGVINPDQPLPLSVGLVDV